MTNEEAKWSFITNREGGSKLMTLEKANQAKQT